MGNSASVKKGVDIPPFGYLPLPFLIFVHLIVLKSISIWEVSLLSKVIIMYNFKHQEIIGLTKGEKKFVINFLIEKAIYLSKVFFE